MEQEIYQFGILIIHEDTVDANERKRPQLKPEYQAASDFPRLAGIGESYENFHTNNPRDSGPLEDRIPVGDWNRNSIVRNQPYFAERRSQK